MKKYTKQQILVSYNVYKASQCTDLNDVNNAISNVHEVIFLHGDCKLYTRRLWSLLKKKMEFEK